MKSPNPTHWGLSFSILATLDDVFSDYCDNSFDWFGEIRSKMLAEMGFYFVQQYKIFMRSFFLQNHHEMSKLLMQIISVIEHWPSVLIISVPR